MAQNKFDSALNEALQTILKIKEGMENVDKVILSSAKNARKLAETSFSSSSAKELNERLSKNATFQKQVNHELKERQRLENALASAQAKFYSAQSGTNKQLQLTRFETNQINKKFREQAVLSSRLATEYQKQSVTLIRLKREYKDVAATYGVNSREAKKLLHDVTRLDRKLKDVDESVGDHQRSVGQYGKAWNGVGKIMGAAVAAFGVYSAIDIGRQIIGQIKEVDSLNKSMMKVVETTEAFNQAQMFLQGVAEQGGLQINELRKSYVKFYASAKTTNLTLKETQDIYEAVALAAANLGLSTDDTNGALRALEQMLSKGNIQAEEIRGQLGERLPGAFQILAKSMGLSTEELNKQLELGNVLAEDVLPKFAEELRKTYDIGDERVETLVAKQNRLNTSWTNFITSLSDSQGVISTTFGSLIEMATKVVNLLGKINSTEFERKEAEAYAATIQEIENTAKRTGKTVQEVAAESVDAYDDEVFAIKERIRLLKIANSEIEKSNGKEGGLIGTDSNRLWKSNAKAIKEHNERLGYYTGMLNAAIALEGEATDQKEELTDETEKNNDATKEAKTILEGSVSAYQAIISELKDKRDRLATTSEEYENYNSQIKEAEANIKRLTEAQKILNVSNLSPQGYDYGTPDTGEDALKKEVEAFKEASAIKVAIKRGETADLEALYNRQLQAAIQAGASKDEIDAIKDQQKEKLRVIEDALQLEQELRQNYENAKKDLVYATFDAIGEARVQSVQDEIDASNEKYAAILANEEMTEEQRSLIEAKREKEQIELEKKKRKREKEAFLMKQGLALAEIAINLARTISAINLAAAAIDAVTLGVGGQIYRATNIPIAIGTAALQTGVIVAQSIPKFKEGHLSGTYEGPALVNDASGSNYKEVIENKDGSLMFPQKRNTLIDMKKGTKVHKNYDAFLQKQNYDKLVNASIMASIADQNQKLTAAQMRDTLDQEIEKKITSAIDKGFKNAKINNVFNNDGLAEKLAKAVELNRRANV